MADEIRGPLDPVPGNPVSPAGGKETVPPESGPPQASADGAEPPAQAAPVVDKIAPGPPPASGTPIQAGNGQGAKTPATSPDAASKRKDTTPEPKDGFREIVETIVFVVVLVLLLKGFLAEAFVIPTGSMATTLLGYHQDVKCPQCGYRSKINMSHQLDPGASQPADVTGCMCQNCLYRFDRPGAPLRERDEP